MPIRFPLALLAFPLTASLAAQQPEPPVALTIYNQDFAVARTQVDLDLHPGSNEVTTTQVTSRLEPDSVVLRDPAAKHAFHIEEQNYDAGVISQDSLLEKFEGKTINFQTGSSTFADGKWVTGPTVPGKILRAPRAPIQIDGQYQQNQPLIEVNGQMQFALPGTPLFPASTDGLLLKPTLRWQIVSQAAQHFAAELAYITGGLSWEANYNIVAPESTGATTEDKADVLGWVTIHNQSGTDFPQARIKLMAGDVAKIVQPTFNGMLKSRMYDMAASVAVQPQVTQKAFDDFHLYDLNRTTSLRDSEIKQIQFIEASGVTLTRSYVYDGAAENLQPWANYNNSFIDQPNYGVNPGATKVQIQEQFKNSEANHLGIPLPAGRIRLYRRDSDGQMEFVGESTINHTPTENTVKIATGNAFDIKGARRQTDFHVNQTARNLDETFEIKLTNQKAQPVTVNVVEHLYRGDNWRIPEKSSDYTKLDSHTLQFAVPVPAKGAATLTYSVHYTW
ncbi:MAG TPA: hypothetical protein VHZ52_03655 [Acidobacteriaceae bacterium]|jgi:hypothetical protein|nr:hypothetical protein [Acidobacteriaceae bacterium]